MQVLPPSSLPDNKTLLEFLEALFQHRLPESLRIYTIFYLALRMTLFTIIAVFIVILLKRRRFWLFRMVKVPKGRILCPNSCEALLFFALTFYVCDSIFRAFTLQWYWDDSSYQTNLIIFTGLRFFPIWVAGFVHVIAITFLGPISPAQMNPHLYHLFLFGMPIALVGSTLVSLVPANAASNKSNQIFQSMRLDLARKPGDHLISSTDLNLLLEIGKYERETFVHFRNWAITSAVFNAALLMMHAVTGTALTFKIYSALRQHSKQSKSASSSDETSYVVISKDHSNCSQTEARKHMPTFSLASTCVEIDEQSLEEPTEKSRKKVLLEFLFYTAAETLCLVAIGTTMLGSIIFLTSRLIEDQQYAHNLPLYRHKLIEVGHTYQLIEMGSVVVFGTPLMIMVLYRQCFPVKVELKEKKVMRQWQGMAIDHPRSSSNSLASPNFAIDTSQVGSPLPKHAEWEVASTISPLDQKSNPSMQASQETYSDRTVKEQSKQEIARDACAYAGHGVGRSIVLEALVSANQYPRRRRKASPWNVITQNSTFTDLDTQGSTQLYATPHGLVESVPMSPIRGIGEDARF